MDLSPPRWLAVVAAACCAAFVTFLPLSKRSVESWVPAQPELLADAMARLSDAAAETYDAVRAYRAAQALERWTATHDAGPDTVAVRLDRSVPASVAPAIHEAAFGQWARFGPQVSAAHAEVFVYVDSTEIPRAATAAPARRTLEPRRFVDVSFALPEAVGDRCVVLVRLRGVSAAHVAAFRDQSLTGVCAFFAAFGLPGAGVRSWLAPTDYAFARQSDWDVSRAPSTDAGGVYGLSAAAARCLTGALDVCRVALGTAEVTSGGHRRAATPATSAVLEGGRSAGVLSRRGVEARLGRDEGRLLADAVRDLGPERFARFWRASTAPDEAFAAAAGTTLDAWTQRWLARTYGGRHGRPTLAIADAVWLAVTLPVLLVVAARPRDRALIERFRSAR